MPSFFYSSTWSGLWEQSPQQVSYRILALTLQIPSLQHCWAPKTQLLSNYLMTTHWLKVKSKWFKMSITSETPVIKFKFRTFWTIWNFTCMSWFLSFNFCTLPYIAFSVPRTFIMTFVTGQCTHLFTSLATLLDWTAWAEHHVLVTPQQDAALSKWYLI